MNQVQVQILDAQIPKAMLHGFPDVAFGVVCVPELGSDPQILTSAQALIEGGPDSLADLRLIAVITRAVQMPVARADGFHDEPGRLRAGHFPETQADGGQLVARVECQRGNGHLQFFKNSTRSASSCSESCLSSPAGMTETFPGSISSTSPRVIRTSLSAASVRTSSSGASFFTLPLKTSPSLVRTSTGS